jgi:hypothetical protein
MGDRLQEKVVIVPFEVQHSLQKPKPFKDVNVKP